MMTESDLRGTVSQACFLKREIIDLEGKLANLRAKLLEESENRTQEMVETDSGGSAWIVRGLDQDKAIISFPRDSILTLEAGTPFATRIFLNVLEHRAALFQPFIQYKPSKDFEALALRLMGRKAGQKLIKLCAKPNPPRVIYSK